MGKIDTSGWKEFRVGELFAAERGKVKNIQPLCPGETPIIAAGAYNQGITGMYEIDWRFATASTCVKTGRTHPNSLSLLMRLKRDFRMT